jgi:phosphoribosylanthranilate isomerase
MKIKICGLFRERDIDYVNETPPDYAGFVFAPSRRQVGETLAAQLRRKLHPAIVPVGVFVNAPLDEIVRLHQENIISIAQLHGGEDREYIARLKERTPIAVIKVLAIDPHTLLPTPLPNADRHLFDSRRPGTGTSFDPALLSPALARLLPESFLAGGIDCDTIDQAVSHNPYCIDISSGAETDGLKDRAKIAQLVRRLRRV